MSLTKNSDQNYSVITKVFHWVMALMIIGMLIVGNVMEGLSGMDKLKVYGLHKSTGILILFLVFLRFGWRQFTYQPPVPDSGKLPPRVFKLTEFAATASHALIYLLMFAMPLSGWLFSSGYGFPVSVYGLFTMPNLIAPDKSTAEFLRAAHSWMAWGLIAILCAHISAALFHHFYLKDVVMKRMLPVIALLLLPVAAQAAEFDVNKTKSSIKFEAVQNNAPVTGEFKDYTAAITFDPAKLETSKAVVEIKIAGLNSAYDEMTANLKSAEWFDIVKFPSAKFESVSITKLDADYYLATGNLTIRDVTTSVPFKFKLVKFDAKEAVIDGQMVLSRNQFGVGQGEWKDTGAVKDDVRVMVHLEAEPK